MNNVKEDFQRMVALAEFGANRHDERRQIEFKIFIAYMTLLVLGFYRISDLGANGWVPALLLMCIHLCYLLWQIRLSIALINDGWRRNFYLKKAECILHHLTEKPNDPFYPRPDRCVTIALGPQIDKASQCHKKGKIYEYELFKEYEPPIVLVTPMWQFWRHWGQLFTDWSRLFQTLIPTGMLFLLSVRLVGISSALFLIVVFFGCFIIFSLLFFFGEKMKRIFYERHKTP